MPPNVDWRIGMVDINNNAARIEKLAQQVKSKQKPGLDEKLQIEIAKLVNLFPYLVKSEHTSLVDLAEIATSALLAKQPNRKLAADILNEIEDWKYKGESPLKRYFKNPPPPVRVVVGMGTLLYFAIPLIYLLNYIR